MKKIPTLFNRTFEGHTVVNVLKEPNPNVYCVMKGLSVATIKKDGSCCMVKDGVLYKRYDAKHGKTPPEGAIPCCNPDPVTGHWPHWLRCDCNKPEDKYFLEAFRKNNFTDGTYELIGPKVAANPYNMSEHVLYKHGTEVIDSLNREYEDIDDLYDSIKDWLTYNKEEGIVFWLDGEPFCKIKRTDFGLIWK